MSSTHYRSRGVLGLTPKDTLAYLTSTTLMALKRLPLIFSCNSASGFCCLLKSTEQRFPAVQKNGLIETLYKFILAAIEQMICP